MSVTGQYDFTLTNGSPLATVYSLDTDGAGGVSTPRQILDVGFTPGANYFIVDDFLLASAVPARMPPGFQFSAISVGAVVCPYPGTYTVVSTAVDLGTRTRIVVAEPITKSPLTVINALSTGVNGVWKVDPIDSAPCTFYPGSIVTVAGNTDVPSNIPYTVVSAASIAGFTHVTVGYIPLTAGTGGTMTVPGSTAYTFVASTAVFQVSAATRGTATIAFTAVPSFTPSTLLGIAAGEYAFTISINGIGNQDYIVTASGADTMATMATLMTLQLTGATVAAVGNAFVITSSLYGSNSGIVVTLPAHDDDGRDLVAAINAAKSATNTNIRVSGTDGSYNLTYKVAGDISVRLTGCQVVIRDNSFLTAPTQLGVVSATFSGGNTLITVNVASVTVPTPDITGSLIFPVPITPYGYIQYDSAVNSSLELVGKGSPHFNTDITWGQAIQDNMIHIMENFANALPPPAPLSGQQWYDTFTSTLHLFGSAKYPIIGGAPGPGGTFVITGDLSAIIPAPTILYVYDNTGLNISVPVVKYTIAGIAEATPSAGKTTITIVENNTGATATGLLFLNTDLHQIAVTGVAMQEDLNLGGHTITNLATPTSNADAATKLYVDTTLGGDIYPLLVSAPTVDQVIKWDGTKWINGTGAVTGVGPGVNFFFTNATDIPSGYHKISHSPDSLPEVDELVTVNNNTVLFDANISDTVLGRVQIDPGVWVFNSYTYVSNAAPSSNLVFEVYSRTSGAVETLLFSVASSAIVALAITEQTTVTVQPAFAVNATDTLVIKVYGTTTLLTNTDVHFVHSGTAHYSYVNSPLLIRHNDLAGVQGGGLDEDYHLTLADYTGTGTGNFVRLNSPTFTGAPLAPTATYPTNTTQIATTAYVTTAVSAVPTGLTSFNTRTGPAITLTVGDVATAQGMTTGSLFIGTGANTGGALTIGANNYVLTSNGTTATWAASTGGVTSFNTRTSAVTLTSTDVATAEGLTTGSLFIGTGANLGGTLAIGTNTYVLTSNGTTATWAAASGGGATITDDTTTNATRYPLYANATSGTLSIAYTASTDYYFNPFTGILSATGFTSLSDANRKTNIQDLVDPMNTLVQLRGVSFNWISTGAPSFGVIAQEVEKVLPQVVHTNDGGQKTVDYHALTAFLIETIKDLNARIEILEGK